MRIDAGNLIAAQAARVLTRPQPQPVSSSPSGETKSVFEAMAFPKADGAKAESVTRADKPVAQPGLPQPPGARLDITI